MKEQEEADRSRGIFALHCHASEITWAHQRRKRRENLRQGVQHVNAGDCPPGNVDEAAIRRMEEISTDKETQGAPEDDNKQKTNISTNFDAEALTSSDARTTELLYSQERPSASDGNDIERDENVSRPLLSFTVRVGSGAEIADDLSRDSVVLEMVWIDGQNKNDLYQLFQYFQNKLLKGF